MFIKNWKKEILTIPNLLSLFRLCLIPVYITIYLNAKTAEHYFLSAGILAVSCLTDMIDGKIARKFNMISNLGKILDPIADKATQFALMLCLTIRYAPLRWLTLLFVVKEGFQLIAGCIILHKGQILKGALITGKICTTILFVSLIILVLMPELPDPTVWIIAGVDCFFLLLAFVDYICAYAGKRDMIQNIEPNTKNEE